MRRTGALFFGGSLASTPGLANPIDAWGPAIPPGVVAVNPNHNVRFDGGGGHQLVTTFGVTKRVDLNLAATTVGFAIPSDLVLEALPRVFLTPELALVAHAQVTVAEPGLFLGPELHSTWPVGENLAVYVDAGWLPLIEPELSAASGFVVAGAEVQIVPRLWPFLESNISIPPVPLGAEPLVLLTPGLHLNRNFTLGRIEACDPGLSNRGTHPPVRLGPPTPGVPR